MEKIKINAQHEFISNLSDYEDIDHYNIVVDDGNQTHCYGIYTELEDAKEMYNEMIARNEYEYVALDKYIAKDGFNSENIMEWTREGK